MDTYQQNSKEFLSEHTPGYLFLLFHGLLTSSLKKHQICNILINRIL